MEVGIGTELGRGQMFVQIERERERALFRFCFCAILYDSLLRSFFYLSTIYHYGWANVVISTHDGSRKSMYPPMFMPHKWFWLLLNGSIVNRGQNVVSKNR